RHRDALPVELGLDLRPAAEADVGAAVEQPSVVRIRVEPVDEAGALAVGPRDVEGADGIAVGRRALDAVLLPVDEERLGDTLSRKSRLDRRKTADLTLPELSLCPVELVQPTCSRLAAVR